MTSSIERGSSEAGPLFQSSRDRSIRNATTRRRGGAKRVASNGRSRRSETNALETRGWMYDTPCATPTTRIRLARRIEIAHPLTCAFLSSHRRRPRTWYPRSNSSAKPPTALRPTCGGCVPLRRATRHDGRATLHGTRAHAHRHGGGGGGDVGIEPRHLRRRRRFLRRRERAAAVGAVRHSRVARVSAGPESLADLARPPRGGEGTGRRL